MITDSISSYSEAVSNSPDVKVYVSLTNVRVI